MRVLKSSLFRATVLAAVVSTLAGAASSQSVGVDAAIRNSVQVKPAGAGGYRPAVVREAVRLGDAFASGPSSSLQVLLNDRSVFTVGANARITIDRFVYDPSRNSSDVAASVTKGAFRFMSGRSLHGQGTNAISTPVATIGVRGTIVEGAVGPEALDLLRGQPGLPTLAGDPANYSLIVLVGPGPNNQGFDTPGAIDITSPGGNFTLIRPGQAVLIWAGGAFGPFQLSDATAGQLIGLLVPPPMAGQPGGPTWSIGVASGAALGAGKPNGTRLGGPAKGVDAPIAKESRGVCPPNTPNCG